MKFFYRTLFFLFVLTSSSITKSFSQNPLTVLDLESSLNKSLLSFTKNVAANGFKRMDELDRIAQELADGITRETGKKYFGIGYGSPRNYAAIVIYDESNTVRASQFGTKKPQTGEIKELVNNLIQKGYKKTSDQENSSGESNMRGYDKSVAHFALASYFNGGYTLTGYSWSIFK